MRNASSFERHDTRNKQGYRHIVQCRPSSTAEIGKVMNQDMNNSVTGSIVQVSTGRNRKGLYMIG